MTGASCVVRSAQKKTAILCGLLSALCSLSLFAAEIDRSAAAITGKEASFTQRFTPKGFKSSQVESGTVTFGTLPMMRWSYSAPESKLFVFDGTKSWFYVPADKQVTVGVIDDARKRELPFLLIGDPAARDRYFVVKETPRGSSTVTTLQPRDRSAMVRDVSVTSDASTHTITRIDYSDREGNRTSFELSGYHPAAAGAETFRFTPPAGTQVVNAQ
ncbi:MAG TPA: outer membrane lipoprotein chaperone LolA [Thermoanaerobaculia bacterium]